MLNCFSFLKRCLVFICFSNYRLVLSSLYYYLFYYRYLFCISFVFAFFYYISVILLLGGSEFKSEDGLKPKQAHNKRGPNFSPIQATMPGQIWPNSLGPAGLFQLIFVMAREFFSHEHVKATSPSFFLLPRGLFLFSTVSPLDRKSVV